LEGYPVGTFLFWEINDEERENYAFYEFIRDYSEHPEKKNHPPAPRHLPTGVTGILDGQQRLNSLWVALCGSYSAFIGGTGYFRDRESSYERKTLFIDLNHAPTDEYESASCFAFLKDTEASPESWRDGKHWFPVARIFSTATEEHLKLQWRAHLGVAMTVVPDLNQDSPPPILRLLRQRIHDEKLIRYFPIRDRSLSEALEIFIRANNGGVQVTAAEMVFATIVAHWPEGRDRIEHFQKDLNQIGHGFDLDVSRILLGILALSGQPIQFRVESFRPQAVDQIRYEFERIVNRLIQAAEMLNRWGLSGNNAVNPNALIALAVLLDRDPEIVASGEELRQFVIRSLLCEWFRRPETALRQVREYASAYLNAGSLFSIKHAETLLVLPSGKTLHVGDDLLEELLMVHINDRRCYILLALIHPHHAQHQHEFHKDHLHPRSGFEDLQTLSLNPEAEESWRVWCDRLPNVQLLQGAENNYKRAKPLAQWLESEFPDPLSRKVFLEQNDIPLDVSLSFGNFESFFQRRKQLLRERLRRVLSLSPSTISVVEPAVFS
jgi:hypothetical protein